MKVLSTFFAPDVYLGFFLPKDKVWFSVEGSAERHRGPLWADGMPNLTDSVHEHFQSGKGDWSDSHSRAHRCRVTTHTTEMSIRSPSSLTQTCTHTFFLFFCLSLAVGSVCRFDSLWADLFLNSIFLSFGFFLLFFSLYFCFGDFFGTKT